MWAALWQWSLGSAESSGLGGVRPQDVTPAAIAVLLLQQGQPRRDHFH